MLPLEASPRRAAVVVAHPDDETLWCGGFILDHSPWKWHIVTLCRGDDLDRAPKFQRVLQRLGATGSMGCLDDGPDQTPLSPTEVEKAVAELLPRRRFDLILTHGPLGEYTRHRRHEECCRAVVELWAEGRLSTGALWLFAYEDGGREYLPRVRSDADRRYRLTNVNRREKRRIVTELYGFGEESWEARATTDEEGFWCFRSAADAVRRISEWGPTP